MGIKSISFATITLVLSTSANAALIDRGSGLIYDSDQNITWLQDANYCRYSPSECSEAGLIGKNGSWDEANQWADNLVYGNHSNWRIPTGPQYDPTCAFHNIGGWGVSGSTGCTGSEMGYLFHVYGIVATEASPEGTNAGPFIQLMGVLHGYDTTYWSATESNDKNYAARFNFATGHTGLSIKNEPNAVWAVHDGDIGAVPIPSAVWLFGSGLIGLIGMARRKA